MKKQVTERKKDKYVERFYMMLDEGLVFTLEYKQLTQTDNCHLLVSYSYILNATMGIYSC